MHLVPSARLLLLLALAFPVGSAAQSLSRFERERGLQMLNVVQADIRKHYFDSAFGGVDLAAIFDTARARIRGARRVEEVLTAIAQATIELDDSHTLFLPPGMVYRAEYGFETLMVGDTCRVVAVQPSSDAAARGVAVGDAVWSIAGFRTTRGTLRALQYLLAIRPQSRLVLELESPGGRPRMVEITAQVVERRRLVDPRSSIDLWELIREGERAWEEEAPRSAVLDGRVLVWRFRGFSGGSEFIDHLLKSARRYPALILDLRGNYGGRLDLLLRLVGGLFAADTPVGILLEREGPSDLIAPGSAERHYAGELVVLVDAGSASAAEMFARIIQLTGRGRVLGDRTAGLVRGSRTFVHSIGTEIRAYYAAAVTVADVVMSDGGRLEKSGVLPDDLILPDGADLHAGRDPVLARALALVGVERDADAAGALNWEVLR